MRAAGSYLEGGQMYSSGSMLPKSDGTRTTPIADADSDLKALGKGKPVKKPKVK